MPTQALLVLLVIALAWAVYLVPPLLNSRKETPLASTEEYNRVTRRLSSVQSTKSASSAVSRSQVLTRRRRILAVLIAASIGTLMYAVVQGSIGTLLIHLIIDAATAWYIAMLLQIKQSRAVTSLTPLVQDPIDERASVKVAAS